ncbi:hypothetical protein Q9L58_010993 [Maublancomyces gigas]|uniref:DUF3304 domain-containing protein n=1 Tax=Discina gigas TaxID=1032678 RepID=A0ABR3G3H9_9PEZI
MVIWNLEKDWMKSICNVVCAGVLLLLVSSCSEKTVIASIIGYNHTHDLAFAGFTVNGVMGLNLAPESGGGGETCCVLIPQTWRPGLTAKVAWEYNKMADDPVPIPASQEAEVEIPEYKYPGKLQVHFYAEHKIKIIVSRCAIDHPFYPMKAQDRLPWASYDMAEEIKAMKRRGERNEC